ncbi:ORF6N domain-containing protein [Escherichia coli]|uniref:ORF6N domain-containing protein n=1 Tax=Escherichia coli TaxID=562 RepID=UPI00063D5167|nr:ORF6N domain-containing protein [Escherichia coli]EKK2831188.1 ORF6N domain-containing protein [Escherichia coli O33]ELW2754111.1 ORF6N domain-containing protein [Escherichia coli O26]EEU5471252.1 ORF6N domain-containing protein [Escherichia coli]EEV3322138.1 ORF6N domain-containing protein [Escherichia coli]EEV3840900.1 ORF6N domain-containing protein [Escherichia coli]
MNTVMINGKQLPAAEYRGQRVVTLAMIDEVHQRPEGTASAAYLRNKERFVEGIDTYLIEYSENNVLRPFNVDVPFRGLRVFTETGYLMLTKPFNDDLAWKVQRELVNNYFRTSKQLSEIEMIAAVAAEAVRQQKRITQVEEKVSHVAETVEQIKRGNIRDGYAGYRQLVAKTGMSDAKCRNLVNAYQIPTDTHEFMTPDGLLSRRAIVAVEPFMFAFHRMMSEAEPRGTRWYHPKMGLFQALGWQV